MKTTYLVLAIMGLGLAACDHRDPAPPPAAQNAPYDTPGTTGPSPMPMTTTGPNGIVNQGGNIYSAPRP